MSYLTLWKIFDFGTLFVYAYAKNWQSLDVQGGLAEPILHQAHAIKNIKITVSWKFKILTVADRKIKLKNYIVVFSNSF